MSQNARQAILEAIDEFLEQGIKSGAWDDLGGTSYNHTAAQEAAILRSHLSTLLQPEQAP